MIKGIKVTIECAPAEVVAGDDAVTLRVLAHELRRLQTLTGATVHVDCGGIGRSVLDTLRSVYGIDAEPLPKGSAAERLWWR